MSDLLDPKLMFEMIAAQVPEDLHGNVLIVGSLAAAYHHREQLKTHAVNTKDADVVVQPAGALPQCQRIAERLLEEGWERYPGKCFPVPAPEPADDLRAIRLYPPKTDAYYIELLGLPEPGQQERRKWVPVKLVDGWYGLPCFRYFAVLGVGTLRSEQGLQYASPSMMALANLLAHPTVGHETMSEPIGGRILLRSAKDLGRVLALAWLAGAEGVEEWLDPWRDALAASYPGEEGKLAARLSDGLRELLDDESALDQARHANEIGLLRGRALGVDEHRAVGEQLISFVLEPLVESG